MGKHARTRDQWRGLSVRAYMGMARSCVGGVDTCTGCTVAHKASAGHTEVRQWWDVLVVEREGCPRVGASAARTGHRSVRLDIPPGHTHAHNANI